MVYQRIFRWRPNLLWTRLSSSLSYTHSTSHIPLTTDTIDDKMRKSVEKFPDRELFIFKQQGQRRTYSQVYEDVLNLAKGLIYLGLERGDRIGIWGPNYYEWTTTQLAAASAGLVLVNLNPAYEAEELKYSLKKVGVKALISPQAFRYSNYHEILCNVIPKMKTTSKGYGCVDSSELPDLKHIIIFNDNGEALNGSWRFEEVLSCGGSIADRELNERRTKIQFDDPANIEFTSGTTGRSKAVVLSHHSIVNNAKFCGLSLGFNENSKVCIPNPLFHCFGCIVGVVSAVIHGSTCVFPSPSFNPLATIASIADEKCTTLYGTPTMFVDILSEPTLPMFDILSAHTALVAGAPVSNVLLDALLQRTNMHNFVVGFGCTELTTAVTLSRLSESPLNRMNSVGHLTPHLEMCIMDENGRIVEKGQPGEVCVRGYSTMREYWADEEQTKKSIDHQRWFHMGDVGYMNSDESLVIVGRIKDMIIRGGENIYPTEIENLILTHPSVRDVQVVGLPDQRFGEEVCAVVQLVEGCQMDASELKSFCQGKLSHFKIPRFILFKHRDYFPCTSSGKIKKNELAIKCFAELCENLNNDFESDDEKLLMAEA